jgi:hypothetical protein
MKTKESIRFAIVGEFDEEVAGALFMVQMGENEFASGSPALRR